MKRSLFFKTLGLTALGVAMVACGSSGGNGTPTLGVTSISKMGVTAIPNANATAKPSFAKAAFDKGSDFLFGEKFAFAAHTPCSANTAPITADIPGGEIEIHEAIVILDEVEADLQGSSSSSPKMGPFALDLLDNDPDAGEIISLNLPAGNYEKFKTTFKRVDDDLNNNIPQLIKDKLLDSGKKRRPSVWIKGWLVDAANANTCTAFTFVTDKKWRVTIPFAKSFSESGNGIDLVVVFDLVDALKESLTDNSADVAALVAERGQVGSGTSPDPVMGAAFLDGRVKDTSNQGTKLAVAWANKIPSKVDVFAQNKGAAAISDSTTNSGQTLLDDSAGRISGDDNPSVSDL